MENKEFETWHKQGNISSSKSTERLHGQRSLLFILTFGEVVGCFGSSLHFISRLRMRETTSPLPNKRTWCHAKSSTEIDFTF
jgi:hypothetical protein